MSGHLAAKMLGGPGRQNLAVNIAECHHPHAGNLLEQFDVLVAFAAQADDGNADFLVGPCGMEAGKCQRRARGKGAGQEAAATHQL